jgi:hypothetical protein
MIKKIFYLFGFLLNQVADKLLEFYWVYYIYSNSLEMTNNKRESFITALILLITLVVFRYVIFIFLQRVFKKTNHYNLHIFSYSIAFVIILLINKLPIDFIIIFLMPLKEFYSVFRVIATKAYLNGVAYKRNITFVGVNLVEFLSIPLAGLIMLLIINTKTTDQIFTFFALLMGPSMIIIYNLFSKNHLVKTEGQINLTTKPKIFEYIIEKMVFLSFYFYTFVCLLVLSLYYKREDIITDALALGVISIAAVFVLVVQVIDRFKVLSHKYVEFENKLLEIVVIILGLLMIMITA